MKTFLRSLPLWVSLSLRTRNRTSQNRWQRIIRLWLSLKGENRLEVERDNYKDSLDTAQNSLKEFEGVDVKELNGKVAQLTADLAKKDTEYQAKISDMEFDAALDNAISASKARNVKALKALLDVETLKASKIRLRISRRLSRT